MSKTHQKTGTNCYGQTYGEQIPLSEMRDTQWAVCIKTFRKLGDRGWNAKGYGPAPGKPGCVVPPWLVEASDDKIENLVDRFKTDNKEPFARGMAA